MVENVCVTVSNYATEALQDTLNFYGEKKAFLWFQLKWHWINMGVK